MVTHYVLIYATGHDKVLFLNYNFDEPRALFLSLFYQIKSRENLVRIITILHEFNTRTDAHTYG